MPVGEKKVQTNEKIQTKTTTKAYKLSYNYIRIKIYRTNRQKFQNTLQRTHTSNKL
jgi:hypothetical protein